MLACVWNAYCQWRSLWLHADVSTWPYDNIYVTSTKADPRGHSESINWLSDYMKTTTRWIQKHNAHPYVFKVYIWLLLKYIYIQAWACVHTDIHKHTSFSKADTDMFAVNVRMSWLVSLEAAFGEPGDWKRPFESWLVHCWGQLGLLFLAFSLGAMGTQYEEIGFPPHTPSQPPTHLQQHWLWLSTLLSEATSGVARKNPCCLGMRGMRKAHNFILKAIKKESQQ